MVGSEDQESQTSEDSGPCALWPVNLKLTHLDWNPEATLIHFQGQYLTTCELDYSILQGEIQNMPKTKAVVGIGEFCLVEDVLNARWYRGRVQNQTEGLFDVFLIDHGYVLSVNIAHISSCSSDLFILPPKIVCGFLANVLLLQGCPHSVVQDYLANLIGKSVTGYIQALLPHKVLLLEAPDINIDLVRHGFGRHVDSDTFLFLVEMLTEVCLKQIIAPVPDLLIEKPRGQEYSFKPPDFRAHEQIVSFCGPTMPSGLQVKVRVTAAVNDGLFYCQMADKEKDLQEMSKKLAGVFEFRTKNHSQMTPETLGLLCSVKRKDGKWYRGFVQYLPVNAQVRVLFIDYGFFESVQVENIHSLLSDISSTPIMAFPCSLSSLTDQDEALKTQQRSFLKEGLLGKVLEVNIRSFDEEKHVYSITVIGAEDSHTQKTELIQVIPDMKDKSVFGKEEQLTQGSYLTVEAIVRKTLGQTVEEEKIQVGSVFLGYVEHVHNPNQFWIRTQKRNEEFEEMMRKMTEHFSQVKLDEDVLLNPVPGTMCCAVYEKDMHFYRGVVTDTLEHGAEVLFIDFGNTEKVPHMLIKKIPQIFARKSAFAFCCTLVNVVPLDDEWSSATSDFFKQTVLNKALLVHVVQMRKNKFVVDLCEVERENNQNITQLLISSKQAEFWNNIPTEPVVQKSAGKKSSYTRSDRATEMNGCSRQWGKCKEEGKTGEKKTEKSQPLVSFKALDIRPGYDFAVQCSNISTPSDFWCQPAEKVRDLEGLMDEIQQYYSTHRAPLKPEESCCVAKSAQDERWYRACLIEKQKDHVKVILVDYGLTITTKEHNLQAIMPQFVHLEGQAFKCSLYNIIEPADPKYSGDWSPEALNLMKDFISTSDLRCTVVSQLVFMNQLLYNVVDLHNPQTKQSISKLLLEKVLARQVTISAKHLSTVFPESFTYSSFDLAPGKEEQVFITHVSNHCEVYCHLERNSKNIEELENKIQEQREKMTQDSTRAAVETLCLAKYLDGKWYRCSAYPVQSPLHLIVFFVDYGNTSILEKTRVLFIPRDSVELLYTPMQAVRCSLASVSKGEFFPDVKKWLDSTILNKKVRAIIAGKSDDGSVDVEMFDGDVNINEKVKELILSLQPQPKPVVSFETSNTRMNNETLQERCKKGSFKSKNPHKVQLPKSPTSKAHIGRRVGRETCKKTENTKNARSKNQFKSTKANHNMKSNTESCVPVKPQDNSKVQEGEKLGTKPEINYPQSSEEMKIPQLSSLPKGEVCAGFRAQCFVSHVDSVNNFFLQLSKDEPTILKMAEDLNSNTFRDSLKTVSPLRSNGLVLAEYEEDGALYRAVVKDCKTNLEVEFVDYGNSAVIGKEKIYSIPVEFLSQHRLSIPCSLLDASMYENDESFMEAVMEKPLLVEFVSECESWWKVKVEIPEEANGLPVAIETIVASSTKTEKERVTPESELEVKENVRSCEENSFTEAEIQCRTMAPQKTLPTVIETAMTLEPPLKPWSPKVGVIPCRRRRRTTTRNITGLKKSLVKIEVKSFVRAKSDRAIIPKTIQAKDTENATILSVLSDGSFYVRLNKASKVLAALENHIADNLHECKMMAVEDVKKDLQCLAQVDKDRPWHRAVIRGVDRGKCWVFLVDHGRLEEIPNSSIRQSCGDLKKIHNLAVLCKVNCLSFGEGESADKLVCETLKSMIGKEVKLVFASYLDADDLWMVEIVLNGQFLITPTSQQEKEDITSTATDTRNDKGGKLQLNTDTGHLQQLVFAPVDIDQAYSGFAAAVTTPYEFCVVLEDLLPMMNKVPVIMDDLPEQMSPLPYSHLVSGKCCLIKSQSKDKWCRAEIVSLDSTVVLYLVDYCLYEYVPYDNISKLKILPEEITNLPKMTYPCILRGVKPVQVDGHWTDEAAVFFQQCLYQKNLHIFFREFVSNTHWKVDILADGLHVAQELVDAGHASYTDIMLGLRFQEQRLCEASNIDEEYAQDNVSSDGKSDPWVEFTDEAEEKMPLDLMPRSRKCFLM
ncbi:tudor domain-containing protein 15 [Xyrichtys novacula]|uniref:Tudor domain-containing protein 15 n=1 Tax=Xyrichtys novacula TaxID=13765 RepID=A0AAV1H112_XYRNO|nr:tudor domain-containing protein 15 [Xyrichtys novacula]